MEEEECLLPRTLSFVLSSWPCIDVERSGTEIWDDFVDAEKFEADLLQAPGTFIKYTERLFSSSGVESGETKGD